jgi:hypothetical protein
MTSSPRFLFAWLAYVLITFALGFVWHLLLFKQTYQKLGIFSRIDDPIVPLGLCAMIIQGAVLAYCYPYFQRGQSSLADGLRFGLLFGLFIASSAVFAEAAKQRVSSLPLWLGLESVYYAIQFSAVGVAIAKIYAN